MISYTILGELRIEQQYTDTRLEDNSPCGVYDKMGIIALKIYIVYCGTDDVLAKGVSYVRCSGSILRSVADKNFIDVLVSNIDMRDIYRMLCNRYQVLLSKVNRFRKSSKKIRNLLRQVLQAYYHLHIFELLNIEIQQFIYFYHRPKLLRAVTWTVY